MIKRTVGSFILRKYLRSILISGALAISLLAWGQSNSEAVDSSGYLKGIVRDAKTKMPVAAARIRALNHEAATSTDENGMFNIKVTAPGEVLLVMAFDYNAREIPVRGREDLEIDLYPEVFTDMYPPIEGMSGPISSSYLTTSSKGTNRMGYPPYTSLEEVIQTRMGGDIRTINHSGLSNNGASLFIRGLNSLNMNAQPLLVVDGVIWNNTFEALSLHDGFFNNSLADIDMNDIENVTVIKDGTSIYGSKGGNGVLLVNTIRGRDMSTKIEVKALGGITEMPTSLPVMDGDQFRIYVTDLIGTMENINAELIDELGFLNDDPSNLDYPKYHNTTNWDREVYRQGISQNYNISVNGGDEMALYAFSIGYTGVKGVVNSTDMNRINTRFNADIFLSDNIKTGLNIGFTNIDRNLLDDGTNFYTSPTYLAMIKAQFLSPFSYTPAGTLTTDVEDSDDFGVGNPTAIIQNALNANKHYRLNLGFKPEFQITPHLLFMNLFDYSLSKVKETYYSPIIGVPYQYIPGLGYSENVFRNQVTRNIGLFNDARLQYNQQFGDMHRVNAHIGMRYLSNYYESDFAEGHNSGSDQKRNLLNEQEFKNTSGLNNEIKSVSNYANVNYSFDNRYFLNATLSVDGSSRFGRETQGGFQMFDRSWGLFPSANAAWLISSESFMAGISVINRLKLRAGYGVSGNDAIDPYAWSTYFYTTRYMDRANGLIIENVANTEIQWETSKKLSLGLDMNLFNDRLGLTADLYSNQTDDLLMLKPLPEIAGVGYYWENGGELSNKGFEISATYKLFNLNSLKWELGASVGHYANKIESLPDGNFITSIYGGEMLTAVGSSAYLFYGYKTNGVFSSDADAAAANLKRIDQDGVEYYFGAGDIRFEDYEEDGIIDEKDKQVIGDPNPDFYGSFNSMITIGNLSIDALFTFSYGNEIYNYLRSQLESGSEYNNQTTAMLKRWTHDGFETSQPKVTYGDPMGNSRFSDRWIEDGSYLRLKSLSLNYRIPLNNKVIEEVNIWISANNIWTLSNYLGRDPEVSASNAVLYQGIDTGLIPVGRSYFLGIKMNL